MKYRFTLGEKYVEVNLSDDLTVGEVELAKTLLEQALDVEISEKKAKRKLGVDDDIDSLFPPLSVRARNVLKRAGCNTIGDVLNCTPSDLKNMRNMGKHTMEEIMKRIGEYGTFKEGGAE